MSASLPMDDEGLESEHGGPCFMKIGKGSTDTRSTIASLKDFKDRAVGLKHDAALLQDFVRILTDDIRAIIEDGSDIIVKEI